MDDPLGDHLATDVAGVVAAVRAAPDPDVPRRGAGQRGGPLAGVLERIERWLAGADDPLPGWVDAAAVRRAAAASGGAVDDEVPHVLTHGDLIPGRALFGPRAREVFRERVGADDATWLRARANALEQALGAIGYYTPRCHPLADVMARTLRHVLDDALSRPR